MQDQCRKLRLSVAEFLINFKSIRILLGVWEEAPEGVMGIFWEGVFFYFISCIWTDLSQRRSFSHFIAKVVGFSTVIIVEFLKKKDR